MCSLFEEKKTQFLLKGNLERVKWMENIHRHVPEGFKRRVQANDKTVLQELVLPGWCSWALLFSWAGKEITGRGRRCILCEGLDNMGVELNEKFVCHKCFMRIKNME